MMKSMKEFFINMFSEAGNTSSIRIIIFVVILTMMFNWTFFNIINNQLASLDFKDIITILGLLAAKIGQKKIELGGGVK